MRRFSIVVAIILLLSAAAPVLACVTDSGMSREESACCRSMHGDCGAMASTGCCRVEIRFDDHAFTPANAPALHVQCAMVQLLNVFLPSAHGLPGALESLAGDHSPPGLRIAESTVLRI